MRLTDLSGTLENGLWGYHELPGLEKVLPPFHMETVATVSKDSFYSSQITATTISGLYLESPAHIIEGGKTLDEYPVERFFTAAKIVKLPRQNPRAQIDGELLSRHAPEVTPGEALLVATGWGAQWNRPGYVLDCPNMKKSALEWVLERRVSLFGVDIPCIESSWSEQDDAAKGSLLRKLFEQDVLLLAPLVNLEAVRSDRGTLVCLPLRLAGTSGAPCRAIFIEES
ncbi:MAG TPA: cyclase family protein [Spirochaetia bacterium]|nr:cyclase family protein [Spirochaetia bacterium]